MFGQHTFAGIRRCRCYGIDRTICICFSGGGDVIIIITIRLGLLQALHLSEKGGLQLCHSTVDFVVAFVTDVQQSTWHYAGW